MKLEQFVLEFGFATFYVVCLIIGFILLRAWGRHRLTGTDYVVALFNLVTFLMHSTADTYFLYNKRLPQTKTVLPDGQWPNFRQMAENAWHQYGMFDKRIYMDRYQVDVQKTTFAAAYLSTFLSFFIFAGHLTGKRWLIPVQIIGSVWHIALVYGFCFQEHMLNYTTIGAENLVGFWGINGPFVAIPLLAIVSAFSKYQHQ